MLDTVTLDKGPGTRLVRADRLRRGDVLDSGLTVESFRHVAGQDGKVEVTWVGGTWSPFHPWEPVRVRNLVNLVKRVRLTKRS